MSKISELRELQSTNAITDLLSTLQTVEINPIELCNRTCHFCPRSQTSYPNMNVKISLDTVHMISDQLSNMNYKNRVSFVGFGEPFLHKQLAECIRIIKDKNTDIKWLEVNTNGDFINRNNVSKLIDAGCSHLTVSMYDDDCSKEILDILEGLNIHVTFKDIHTDIQLVNRIDIYNDNADLNLNQECYIPFYKMFIDWNGDVLLCNNDWKREGLLSNIFKNTISEIWLGNEITKYRSLLQDKSRSATPCNKCNVDGVKYGYESYKMFQGL